jgi:S-formylglutathione hydrolase
MYSYVTSELPAVIATDFPADMSRQSIFGHSMGGHGALIAALRNPSRYKSCSAFSPIVHPSTADWSRPALATYLGENEASWRKYDAVSLIEDGARVSDFLVDQGSADQFLADGLRPQLLQQACDKAKIPLTLRMQEGYDHSYFFISTFMTEHIIWHASRLG